MGRTLGIHWIATTHGTWLHGDPRGSWRGGKLIGADPFLEEAIRRRMTAEAVVLDDVEMLLVATAFGRVVDERRWTVWAGTIRPTHVHLIFAPLNNPIEDVIATLKYRSAAAVLKVRRSMRREAGRSLWTEGRYPVFLFDDDHLTDAVEYVRRHNHRAGRASNPFEWITPFPERRAPD